MSGAIFETWVMAELLKSYWLQGRQAPFYYYRDKDQREIDLLIPSKVTVCFSRWRSKKQLPPPGMRCGAWRHSTGWALPVVLGR